MKFMITKKGSSPVTNCQKDEKEEPRSSRKLVLALSAFRFQEYTQRTIAANDWKWSHSHQMEDMWQLQYL